MRIVHVTGYFAVNMAYQENLLPVGQAEIGHEVFILTGRNDPDFGFNRDSRNNPAGCFDYHGVTVCRLEHYLDITNKGPILKGLLVNLRRLRPDVLFIHDIGTSFITGLWYKLLNPDVHLQVDCHSTPSNARNSRLGPLYHGMFKVIYKLFKNRFDRIFATAPETVDFMCRYYGLNKDEICLLPLPGDSSLLAQADGLRAKVRCALNIPDDHKVLIHTGKLPGDKETLAVLEMFKKLKGDEYKLLVAGSIDKNFQSIFNEYKQNDPRIIYIGWVGPQTLREIFIASDLLVQPGSLSNTFIEAICCKLPVVLDDTPQGRFLTSWDNGCVVERGSIEVLLSIIQNCLNASKLLMMRTNSEVASQYFNYQNNARMTLDHLNITQT